MKNLFPRLILILCLSLTITACDDDNITYTTLTVEIDGTPKDCCTLSGSIVPGMWVKEGEKGDWRLWPQSEIEGFTYEEGYCTKAKIRKKTDWSECGGLSHGGKVNYYKLLKVLEKKEAVTYTTLTVEIGTTPTDYFDIAKRKMVPGMWVKEEGKSEWSIWPQSEIEGYTYEEGYYTKAQIRKRCEYLLGDTINTYKFLEMLEKEEAETSIR